MAVSTIAKTTLLSTPKLHLMSWPSQRHDEHANVVRDAYARLTHDQLVLFLTIRSLPTHGTDVELAGRLAHYDLQMYNFPNLSNNNSIQPKTTNGSVPPALSPGVNGVQKPRQSSLVDLPIEILADILDNLGDWELSRAVGLPTSLHRPLEWSHASSTDEAMLTGFVPLIRASDPARCPPTVLGATVAVRFGYTHVLEMLMHSYRQHFSSWFKDDIIPIVASHHGRTGVLTWWKHAVDAQLLPAPKSFAISQAIDGACRNGVTASLDWWAASQIPLDYSEAALESASAKNHIAVLEWWRRSGLPLKIGRVMDMASSAGHVTVLDWWLRSNLEFKYDRTALHHASMHGKVDVLQWWLESGLQMIFDQDALTLATRHNRPEVLEWWNRSGLPAQYRICDIEEALEDAIGGGEAARVWWRKKGVNFNANDTEWMKLQTLN